MLILRSQLSKFEVFDVGSSVEHSVFDFASTVSSLTNKQIRIEEDSSFPHSKDDNLFPDLSKLQNIGWMEKTQLAEGIRETLNFMQNSNLR
jgi:nucleoside-diphosphate-sugar epimerase